MRGAVLCGPGDVRVEEREEPRIVAPTDAIVRLSASCVCGSDLWPYRGVEAVNGPSPMGHEYVGVVEEVGPQVHTIGPGQFVVGSFWASDNSCALCRAGYQSCCVQRVLVGTLGAQAERLRVPWADGTLVATPQVPPIGFVGVAHGVALSVEELFFSAVHLHGGPARCVGSCPSSSG
jgi:threonine dehydrogenase-like Zn-dependent dehydrogenase